MLNSNLDIMSNMRADVKLITVTDARYLKRLQKYLDNKEYTIIYVHINHVCPNNNEVYQCKTM